MASIGAALPIFRIWTAAVRSFSAYSTHSRRTIRLASSGAGIQHLAFPKGWPFNRAHNVLPPGEVLRPRDQDVNGYGNVVQYSPKLHHRVQLRPLESHHDQQIDITVRPGVASRLRTEQDDLLRSE